MRWYHEIETGMRYTDLTLKLYDRLESILTVDTVHVINSSYIILFEKEELMKTVVTITGNNSYKSR
jgi:hypothetical protein